MSKRELPKAGSVFAGVHHDEDGNPLFCVEIGGALFNVGPVAAVEKFLQSYHREIELTGQ